GGVTKRVDDVADRAARRADLGRRIAAGVRRHGVAHRARRVEHDQEPRLDLSRLGLGTVDREQREQERESKAERCAKKAWTHGAPRQADHPLNAGRTAGSNDISGGASKARMDDGFISRNRATCASCRTPCAEWECSVLSTKLIRPQTGSFLPFDQGLERVVRLGLQSPHYLV